MLLNEYCWKFNRRFFRDSKKDKYDLFDHLIRTAAQYTSDIKWRDYEKVTALDIKAKFQLVLVFVDNYTIKVFQAEILLF